MCPRPKAHELLGAKREADLLDEGGLWIIHGEAYDLSAFRERHPGGTTALDLCRGSDATDLFEQFHVMTDLHRAALRKYRVGGRAPATAAEPYSAFHEDVKAMVRDHFGGRGDAHKASWEHLGHMAVVFAVYAAGWRGWWAGDVVLGGLVLPVCAWLIMANFAHDGSHHAVSRKPWVNELALLTSSPLLYSYGSWYQQHCASHHLETNDPDSDVDVQHHPFTRWHRSMLRDSASMTGVVNLFWHFTAFLVSTINMSNVHPWKFVFVPWVQRHLLNQELPPYFSPDNDLYCDALKAAGKDAPHELAFFKVSGRMHRQGFMDGWRGGLAVASFLSSVAFLATPYFRFGPARAAALTLLPYLVTSAFFFTVTQISHVQAPCQKDQDRATGDFFKIQATTSLDYGVDSELWRFLTGGLNVQAIHHVLPVVNSCHYTKLYPKFYALCEKHGCAPANRPGILSAGYAHLKHIYDLGELYTGPHVE
ncbi:fatty acid desaturase [Aureococcus anophagefferens]|uniref:Fatty acid desaturase n=1 Tax=Aureococcus anophagefferens TaxID=44056 RepID=A0ABR1FWG1_AURAN|nr:hypothetical protein JL720_8030 [Aureococcus anophagefferens]